MRLPKLSNPQLGAVWQMSTDIRDEQRSAMLPDDTIIWVTHIPPGQGGGTVPVTKAAILDSVRALYLAECSNSILPDEKVNKQLAAELVACCLEPR